MIDKMKLTGEFEVIPLDNANIWCMLLDVLLCEKKKKCMLALL